MEMQPPPPGYSQPVGQPAAGAPVVVTQTVHKEQNSMRAAIPVLPIPVAVICGIINFILPGIGTIIAGFSVLCCGNVGQSGGGRVGTFCINFWVGLLQLLTVAFFLVGWIWSIIWGVAIIAQGASGDGGTSTTTTVVTGGGGVGPTSVVAVST